MITVTRLYSKNRFVGFSCSGHANRGDYGYDLACSAVSAITQTCLLGITEVLNINACIQISEDEGIFCLLPPEIGKVLREKAGLLLQTMCTGLTAVENEYPGILQTIDREV